MNVLDGIKKIEKYLSSREKQALFVNIQNQNDFSNITQHFRVGNSRFISVEEYCKEDENPNLERLINDISTQDKVIFITGIMSYLRFEGEEEITETISPLLSKSFKGKIVFLCYQCQLLYNIEDPRKIRRIVHVTGTISPLPHVIFVAKNNMVPANSKVFDGIQKIYDVIETFSDDHFYVRTSKKKCNYPKSLYMLEEIIGSYDAVKLKDSQCKDLLECEATDTQWDYLLQLVNKNGSVSNAIASEFGISTNLEIMINSWTTFSHNERWLYYLGIKLYGSKKNWYLGTATRISNNLSDFIRSIYRLILEYNYNDLDFWDKYEQRKKILNALGNPIDEAMEYCKFVISKQEATIYYLTDNTKVEREKIVECICKYAAVYNKKKLSDILKKIYPSMADYLVDYRFKNNLLDEYFSEYKYGKLTNFIPLSIIKHVEEQGLKRDYNLILPTRAEVLEDLKIYKTQAYFIDALGVEYLGYILEVCRKKGLIANITVCHSCLPSITSQNKEFLKYFEDNNVPVNSIKELDGIKHHGKEDFDYRNVPFPFHLIRELEILEEVLDKIKAKLVNGVYNKAILVSDHGASRLSVLANKEAKWEMASKGEHSGRCCPVNEADVSTEFATKENGFWVLANYDRFKGGRKANVEVHGGATLEEVVIPIIELMYRAVDVEVKVLTPIVMVGFKKMASIQIYCSIVFDNVCICIDGEYFQAVKKESHIYQIDMPQLKRAKEYSFDVYDSDNIIKSALSFTIQKEGVKENELF